MYFMYIVSYIACILYIKETTNLCIYVFIFVLEASFGMYFKTTNLSYLLISCFH